MRAAVLIDPERDDENEQRFSQSLEGSHQSAAGAPVPDFQPQDYWRQEVASRVQQHRARRRKRGDPNATMELGFPVETDSAPQPEVLARAIRHEAPKIIEFPRPLPAQSIVLRRDLVDDLELAEPVLDTPRILEVPQPEAEQMNFLPAFADIELAAEESRLPEEVELPPQPAPLQLRVFAGLVDLTVVLVAGVAFAATFVGFASGLPKAKSGFLCALLIEGVLWLLYQYIFLVFSTGTLGMRVAQLEICTFKGEPVSLLQRRRRAFATALSGFSLGLGFAWSIVDEDRLGWHDRITQTHLRERHMRSAMRHDVYERESA